MVMAIATAAARLAETKTISSVELVDHGQSKADHDRNCPRPSSEGQGQWMGGLIEQLGPRDAIREGFQLLMAAFAEKRPFGHGDDKAAGDPQRYRYSLELEDQRAQEKRETRPKSEFLAMRQARTRRISGVAPRVSPRKTSADPGGLTTGKIAAKAGTC